MNINNSLTGQKSGKVFRFIRVGLFSLGFALTAGSLYAAWSPPPAGIPPNCPPGVTGCDAPINVSNNFQSKDANLMVNALGTFVTGLSVPFGNVGIGTTLPSNTLTVAGINTGPTRGIADDIFSADTASPMFSFRKSRSAVIGSHTPVVNGDSLGNMRFQGSDGTNYIVAANITADVDGTPGVNDMPGRLIFSTTPDGASAVVERMRINSAGNVGIGVIPGVLSAKLDVNGSMTVRLGCHPAFQNNALNVDFCGTFARIQAGLAPRDILLNPFGGNIGIGTAVAPTAKLEIAGQIKITGGTPVAGQVLTTDATGLATWEPASGGSVGGSGTLNYVPKWTPDASTLGNSQIFDSGTTVGIGTTASTLNVKLDVRGGVSIGDRGDGGCCSQLIQNTNSGHSTHFYTYDGSGNFQIHKYGAGSISGPAFTVYNTGGSRTQNLAGIWTELDSASWGVITNGDIQAAAFYYPSDVSLKKNITTIPNALASVLRLRGVEFDWITPTREDKRHSLGLIAQEVEEVYPELVTTDPDGKKSVQYGNLVGPLIEAVRELKAENDDLRVRIEKLEAKN